MVRALLLITGGVVTGAESYFGYSIDFYYYTYGTFFYSTGFGITSKGDSDFIVFGFFLFCWYDYRCRFSIQQHFQFSTIAVQAAKVLLLEFTKLFSYLFFVISVSEVMNLRYSFSLSSAIV